MTETGYTKHVRERHGTTKFSILMSRSVDQNTNNLAKAKQTKKPTKKNVAMST